MIQSKKGNGRQWYQENRPEARPTPISNTGSVMNKAPPGSDGVQVCMMRLEDVAAWAIVVVASLIG